MKPEVKRMKEPSWAWTDPVWAAKRRYYVGSFAITGPFTDFCGLLLSICNVTYEIIACVSI